ncbi:hypothetical protein Tco_1157904 [Tanacetum coccineum]
MYHMYRSLHTMPPEDDVLPTEEQPLPAAVLPTADSPGYITESDPEEDPEKDDEDPEEDPADYPDDRDEEEEEESSGDDADYEEEDEDEDEEEEEEHLAPADSVPPPAYRITARMSIRDQTPIPFPSDRRAAMIRLRAESPSTSHPLSLPLPIVLPHTRASIAMMRAVAPSTYILASRSKTPPSGTPPLLPIPLPTSSPPLLLPSTDCRADVPEVMLPPRKRLCIDLGPKYVVGESSFAPTARPTGGFRADYGFVGTLDAEIRCDLDREIGYGIRDTWDEMSMDASDTTRSDVRVLRTTVLAQQTEIRELRAIDRRRQTQLTGVLTLLRILQMQMAVLQS